MPHPKKDFLVASLGIIKVLLKRSLLVTLYALLSINVASKESIELLALNGDLGAQLFLGNHYRIQENKDLNKSVFWMTMAAESLNPLACRYVGRAYWLGNGVMENKYRAISFLMKGAKLEDIGSLISLSLLHEEENQFVRAHSCLRQALSIQNSYKIKDEERRMRAKIQGKDTKFIDKDFEMFQLQINHVEFPPLKNKEQIKTKVFNFISYKSRVIQRDSDEYGRKEYEGGQIYFGNLSNGLEHGYGTLFNQDGIVCYEGIWWRGKPSAN